jgi:fatty-acyl-CoA synthase
VTYNHATLFEVVARALPDRAAITFRNRRVTYKQLLDRANRFANALLAMGIRHPANRADLAQWESGQDHVALYLYNCNEYLEATLGANRARAVPFNVNYRYVESELAYLLTDASAAVVVYGAAFASTLAPVMGQLARTPKLVQVNDGSDHDLLPGAVDYEELLAAHSPDAPTSEPSPDDLHIVYTGGTTGMPKGTLWRQADAYEAALAGFAAVTRLDTSSLASASASAATTRETRSMAIPPFMHGAACWSALGCLLAGGTVVIQSEVTRFDAADVLRTVQREKVQSLLMVGDAFARPLCEELEKGRYDISTVSVILSGGATLSLAVKKRLLDLIPRAIVLDVGASSETGTQMSSVSSKGQTAELSVFSPNEFTFLVDDTRQRVVDAGHDEPGWLAKRGAIPLGYLGDEIKTATTFPTVSGVRMVIPGDRARIRIDGMIELLGRESMVINTGGEKVFVEEVEQAIVRHPSVDDVLVVGRPSDKWGQEVVAVVQLRHDCVVADAEILATAAEQVARFKLPKAIVRVPQVQRNPSGKADYAWAKQQVVGGPST